MSARFCLTRLMAVIVCFGTGGWWAGEALAQQVTVGTPMHNLTDSFFEHTGVNWGLNFRGGSARFGSPNMAAPQFGGFDPNAGISGGIGTRSNNFNGFLNFNMSQGSRRSFVSQTPNVTMMNGYPASIYDNSLSPFVVGFVPIVGGFPTVPYSPMGFSPYYGPGMMAPPTAMPGPSPGNPRVQAMLRQIADQKAQGQNPAARPQAPPKRAAVPPQKDDVAPARAQGDVARAAVSSAAMAVPSVAEARRLHQIEQADQDGEVRVLIERALAAEEGGKPGVAKVYYRMAAQRATGQLKAEVQGRLAALDSSGGS